MSTVYFGAHLTALKTYFPNTDPIDRELEGVDVSKHSSFQNAVICLFKVISYLKKNTILMASYCLRNVRNVQYI